MHESSAINKPFLFAESAVRKKITHAIVCLKILSLLRGGEKTPTVDFLFIYYLFFLDLL